MQILALGYTLIMCQLHQKSVTAVLIIQVEFVLLVLTLMKNV